jgi:hypothetical protein
VRRIVDDVDGRGRTLLADLGVNVADGSEASTIGAGAADSALGSADTTDGALGRPAAGLGRAAAPATVTLGAFRDAVHAGPPVAP